MHNIFMEYLDILNTYIKIKSYDKNTDTVDYSIIGGQESLKELYIIIRTFWTCHYSELIKQMQNKTEVLTTYLDDPRANYEEEIGKLCLISDNIILRDDLSGNLLTYESWNRIELIDFFSEYLAHRLYRLNSIKEWIEEGLVTLIPPTPYLMPEFCQKVVMSVENDMKNNELNRLIIETAPTDKESFEVDRILHPGLRREEFLPFNFLSNLNISLCTAGLTKSIPVTTSEYEWRILLSKLEYEQKTFPKDFILCNSIQGAKFPYFTNITPEKILKLRNNGEIGILRGYLRSKFSEIQAIKDKEEFQEMVEQVNREIVDEVKLHTKECELIKKTFREKMGIKGSLAIASATFAGVATFGLSLPIWIGVIGGTLSGYSLKDITEEILKYREKMKSLKSNGLHILIQSLR